MLQEIEGNTLSVPFVYSFQGKSQMLGFSVGCCLYMYTYFLHSSNSHEQIEGHSSRPFTGNGGNINLSVIHLFLGFVRFLEGYYIILITERRK